MMILQQTRGNLSSGDQLALDLQFALDKTTTARIGPTPVFTRASTGTFVGSNGLIQSAAVNAARFDHNPVTTASRGLLIEESRTNLVLQSENHSSATWSKTGGSVASIANTAPDGSANSNLFSEDSSTGVHRIFQATACTSGVAYTISVFLKYAGRQFISIQHPAVASNNIAIFDIQNGVITFTQSSVTSSITPYPNGWYRCSVTGTAASTGNQSHIIQGSTTGNFLTGSYAGLNGAAFYIYGSQVEAGSFATSYIPTTTSTAVRSADLCNITGSDFTNIYNSAEGTMFIEMSRNTNVGSSNSLSLNSSSNTNRADITYFNQTVSVSYAAVTGFLYGFNPAGNIPAGTQYKVAYAIAASNHALSLNGASPLTNNTAAMLVGTNKLSIGSNFNNVTTGTFVISSVKYYKRRLPNAKLQALTV